MASFSEYNDIGSRIADLIALVKSSGGDISNEIEIRTVDSNQEVVEYGIFSKNPIKADKVLMTIPYRLCISAEAVITSPKLQCIFESDDYGGLVNFPDEVMAIGIMSTLSTDLPWSLHVSTMPKTVNSSLYWDEEEVQFLSPCTSFHLTKLMNKQIEQDWESIHKPLSQAFPNLLEKSSIETYKWSLSMIYSRAIGFIWNDKYVRCIPPVLDMANHNPTAGSEAADTFAFNEEKEELQLINFTAKGANQECFAVYGTYPNAKLLLSYGFVVQGNKHRAIDLWTRVGPTSNQAERKQNILNEQPLTRNQTYDFTGTIRQDWISPSLLSTIRIIQCNDMELDSGDYEQTFKGNIISIRNEIATYASLKDLIIARMKVNEAETERQELLEMTLANTSPNNRKFMALVVKVEERELLQDSIVLIDSWVESLSVDRGTYDDNAP